MALEQKLSLKLAQKLVMTPSLQQAIKLLQMTRIELEGVLTQELVENPVLEEHEVGAEEEASADERESEQLDEALSDIDVEAYFDNLESWEGSGASMHEHREGPPLENTIAEQDDLYDHLLWQLRMTDVPPLVREIAELIIGNLEPDGFLVASIEEIQAMGADGFEESGAPRQSESPQPSQLAQSAGAEDPGGAASTESPAAYDGHGSVSESAAVSGPAAVSEPGRVSDGAGEPVIEAAGAEEGVEGEEAASEEVDEPIELPEGSYPREAVEEALALVRSLDPPGVACFDLRESLLIQLDRLEEPEDSLCRRVIDQHWDLFSRRKFEQIAREMGVPLQSLRPVVELVGNLETRPGREFDNDSTQYVEPDVHVVKVGGEYVIQLNDNGLPRLRVSRAYRKMLSAMRQAGSEEDAQAYIKEKMRSAMWLIKSLDQRQRTIYKVAESIVKQQRGFLDNGVDHLRPMVLRDVAEDIEMHESTVSRVVSNKYIHTPRGLLPMKFFFHSGIDREYGGDISSLTVKRKIKQLIQDEEPKKPLSDSELMRILKREGIQIARRTVAKYRDELGIPSSTERKRIF